MAWYSGCSLHYHGRLVDVSLRYGCIDDPSCVRVVRGKPLRITDRDVRRIDRLIARKPETRRALVGPYDDSRDVEPDRLNPSGVQHLDPDRYGRTSPDLWDEIE
ncbi:MAG: hypothetical protein V1723_01740 [Candidatus Uhrbacteria bacterium]